MVNFKKIDDHDFIFVNKPLTSKEERDFSDFLKNRKSRAKQVLQVGSSVNQMVII